MTKWWARSTCSTPQPGALDEVDRGACRALADVATIALLQERALREARLISEQLQRALNSRVIIEQAKGVLAGQAGLDMDTAFRVLRDYARSTTSCWPMWPATSPRVGCHS